MDIYRISSFREAVEGNSYPGRGIVVGKSQDGTRAVIAYFIMGRSVNSRNRVFVRKDDAVFSEPFDASLLQDPSLIIYAAVRSYGNHLVVTNGDQTDTVVEGLAAGDSFHGSLRSRQFEPDAPNLTPRISADVVFDGNGGFKYSVSILKSADAEGTACSRYGFDYEPVAGLGHFIHTYECDGDPLPTFQGEPERIAIPDSIDGFADEIWNSLDEDNKISLYVRYTDLATGAVEDRLFNKHQK